MWKKKGSRTQTNRASAINSGRLQSRTRLDSLFSGCSLFSLLLLLTPLRAAVVNVSINPETSPLQTHSGSIVPDGTALFVVSYKTTQDAFFTALRGANTAADLVAVFSNQLQFFNSTPFLKGDYGTYENPNIGWSSEGGATAEITPTTTSNLPVFTLFSSSTNPFDPTASFILLKSRGTNLDSYIPKDDSPSTIEISGDSTSGSDVIFGQFFSSSGAFRMATAAAYGQITSATTLTMNAGSISAYLILSNNGANSFSVTSLPTWASLNSVTGVITLAPEAGISGTFTFGLSAINSLTGSAATVSLAVTVQAATGPAFTSSAAVSATAGIAFSHTITTDALSTLTVTSTLPVGLSLDTSTGVLSGIPRSADSFPITIRAARTSNGASFTDQNLVLTVSLPTLAISALVSGQLTRTAGTAYSIPVTIPAGLTVDSYTFEPEITGVTYSGGNLLISSIAAPFVKGTTKETLTLTLNRTTGLNGSTISASLPFDLRLEAPAPKALTTHGPFEVTVGDDYSLQLLTDVSTFCPNQNIAIVGTLPPDLINNTSAGRKTGSITGKNTSTTLPYEFTVNVVADTSTFYEGGGTLTVPVIFRLRNPVAPVITSESTRLAGVGKTFAQYTIEADGAPSRFTASGLPPGIVLDGANLKGTPIQAGNYDVRLEAYNSYRPGSILATDLQSGTSTLRIFVSGSKPTTATPLSGSSNLQAGRAASFSMLSAQQLGLRISGYGFPPGLTIDSSTGLVTGTPTAAGTYSVTVFIQNGKGWIKKTVSLAVR
jgi:hypothetical protein